MTNTEKAASVLTSNDVQRAVRRIAHEIIEHVASVAGSLSSPEKIAIMASSTAACGLLKPSIPTS